MKPEMKLKALGALLALGVPLALLADGLSNPGFESNLTGWTTYSNMAADSTVAHSGSKSARITVSNPSSDHTAMTLYVPVVAGRTYTATCQIRTENVSEVASAGNNGTKGACLNVEWYNSSKTWLASGKYSKSLWGTANWRLSVCSGLTAPSDAAYAKISLMLRGSGKAWFDDVTFGLDKGPVTRISPASGASLADNTPLFSWAFKGGVGTYTLQVSQNEDFPYGSTLEREVVASTSYQWDSPLAPGTWHWRVLAEGCPDASSWTFTQTAAASRDCLPPRCSDIACRVTDAEETFWLQVTSEDGLSDIRLGDWEGTVAQRVGNVLHCKFISPDGGWPAGLTETNLVAVDNAGNASTNLFWLLNAPQPANAVTIDANGFYRVGGERFFPLMIFEVELGDMADVAAAGFDVVHNYKWEKNRSLNSVRAYLDSCTANGLRAFIGFDRGTVTGEGLVQGDVVWAARRVGALADHPGLFCWYLYDEPDKADPVVTPEFAKKVADLVRTLDPWHPVTLTTGRENSAAYRTACDTYWAQAYGSWAEGYGNPKAVANRIDEMPSYMGGDTSPVTVLLNCNDREQGELRKQGVEPDPSKFARDYDHLRACAFLGLAKECNGDCWWWFGRDSESFYSAAQCPPAWTNLSAIVQELRVMRRYAHAAGTVSTGTATSGSNKVAWWYKTMSDGAAFVAVNTSSNAVTVNLTLPGLASRSVTFRGHEVKTGYMASPVDTSIIDLPVIALAPDTDMTLSQALANAGVSSLGTKGTIYKYGKRTITVDDASGIGSFTGDIHVCEGGWSVGTAAGFGTSAGETWIDDGACVLITDVTVSHTGETFHLAGKGKSDWYGWGAIRFASYTQELDTMAAGAYGSRWILEDDATVMLTTGPSATAHSSFLPAIDLELNGHELTLWRGHYGTIATTKLYGNFNSVTGAGDIVCKNGVQFIDYCFSLPGTAANSIVLQNARLNVWETQAMNTPWRLVARPTPIADWHGNAISESSLVPRLRLYAWGNRDRAGEHDFQIWPGPVTLEGDLRIEMENQNRCQPMTFTNKVTGAGGFAVTTGKAWLYLDCPENDFQGGVTLCGPDDRLVLANDGALPADGGRLLMTNSTVAFPATVSAPWSLPALELAGASEVRNCQGNWKSVTALSGADASYKSALGADDLILKSGSKLTVHSLFDPAAYAGWEEHYTLESAPTEFADIPFVGKRNDPRYLQNNSFPKLTAPSGSTGRSLAYSTYIWNHSQNYQTWTFAGHFGGRIMIFLNGVKILDYNRWQNPYRVTGTLRPGPNRVVVVAPSCGWAATADGASGTWAGINYKGFVYYPGEHELDDQASYLFPDDPGDGSFCTTMSGDESIDGVQWSPHFKSLTMEQGSVLDLDGGTLSVETATGSGTVVNGSLAIAETLAVDAGVLAGDGGIEVNGNLSFGAGAKISFPDADAYYGATSEEFTLATATGTISGFKPSMLDLGNQHSSWGVGLSANGKAILLRRIPVQTVLMLQ